jgi:hypothetical protein
VRFKGGFWAVCLTRADALEGVRCLIDRGGFMSMHDSGACG